MAKAKTMKVSRKFYDMNEEFRQNLERKSGLPISKTAATGVLADLIKLKLDVSNVSRPRKKKKEVTFNLKL